MSFMDYTPALSSDTISWYIYLEVFLRGNFDDVVTVNTAVKRIETVIGIKYSQKYIIVLGTVDRSALPISWELYRNKTHYFNELSVS